MVPVGSIVKLQGEEREYKVLIVEKDFIQNNEEYDYRAVE